MKNRVETVKSYKKIGYVQKKGEDVGKILIKFNEN